MTKEEFDERIGYHATDDEFSRVNIVYEYSVFDKDEFCRRYIEEPFTLAEEMCNFLQNANARVSFLTSKNQQLEQKIDEALKALYIEASAYSDDGYKRNLLSKIKEIGGLNRFIKLILADELDEGELESVMSQLE
jgi:hypothetical protein